jgi:hypothetical protein
MQLCRNKGGFVEDTEQQHQGHDLHVVVSAPREPEPREFTFPPEEKVGQAANYAAAQFGYATSNFSFQTGTVVLNRDLTLAAAGVRNGEKLTLVDVGGGV